MARPLRIEFPGAVYHVTSRGNAKQSIFLDNSDRTFFLDHLHKISKRFNWRCHSYCLMGNHYHLLIETVDGVLSQGMRQLNGVYAQRFNACHDRVGHLFQGRYKAILVTKDSYLLELARYIVLNPVRAGVVEEVHEWAWSSYRGIVGLERAHAVLSPDWLLMQMSCSIDEAIRKYKQFVYDGIGGQDPGLEAAGSLLLGGSEGSEVIGTKLQERRAVADFPIVQRFADRPELSLLLKGADKASVALRNDMIRKAVLEFGYTQTEVAVKLGLHCSTVSRAVTGGQVLIFA